MGIKSKKAEPAWFTHNFTKLQRSHRWALAGAFAASLLLHALWLSLDFGGGLGLPGLALPWQVRRAEVPEIRIVLKPAAAVAAALQSISPPSKPPLPSMPAPLSPEGPATPAQSRDGFPTVRDALPPLAPDPTGLVAAGMVAQVEALAVPVQPQMPSAGLPVPSPAAPDAEERTAVTGELPSTSHPEPNLIAMGSFDAAALRVRTVPDGPASALAAAPAASIPQTVAPEVRQAAALEAARSRAERLAAAAQEAGRAARAQAEALVQVAANQEAARQAAERQRAQVLDSARLEAERQQAVRVAMARQEAAALEATRLESARRQAALQEVARREAERDEAAGKVAARQEVARQEVARQELARQELARQQATKDAARQDALRSAAADEARREDRLRAIGRQLNEEAAQRDAAASAAAASTRSLPSASTLRRGRLFGLADPDTELVLYAEAWARKIQLNQTFELVREAAKRPHVDPLVTVAVRRDGSIESVTFVRSSGVADLDEAARRVVHSQLPYQPFSPALAREYDVIEIRRSWHFDMAIRLY